MDGIVLWQVASFFGLLFILALSWMEIKASRIAFSGALLWLYCLSSSLFLLFRPFDFLEVTPNLKHQIAQSAGQAFILLLFIPVFVFSLKKSGMERYQKVISSFAVIDSALVFVLGHGLLGAGTFDAAVVAMLSPLCPKPFLFIGVATVWWTHSGTGLLVLFSQLAVWFFNTDLFFRHLMMPLVIVASGFGALSVYGKTPATLLDRLSHLKNLFHWWLQNANPWVGTGIGSFFWLSPEISKLPPHMRLILFGHNDWAQLLFEGGGIALSLAIVFFIGLFQRTTAENKILLAGMAACMVTYHPLHYFISAFVCAFIVRRATLK